METRKIHRTVNILLNLFSLVGKLKYIFITSICFRLILMEMCHIYSVSVENQEILNNNKIIKKGITLERMNIFNHND